jgi:demethylmenaquinone methyltransferase/2-methoxy-6-polyprenyl-1,4-benzoquinol methylase
MRPGDAGDAVRRAVRGPRGGAPDLEPAHVADLFDRNAATYDRINTIITFGLDASWRRWAARQASPPASGVPVSPPASGAPATALRGGEPSMRRGAGEPPSPPARRPRVLDACAGTGLLARDLARRGATVTAADAAPGMLAVARARLNAAGRPLRTVVADLSDPATAGTLGGPFDAVTLGFGLRYFADPGALLRPLRGLLAPGGRLVVVEAVRPPRDLLGAAAGFYFFEVAPRLGTVLAGRAELYDFLTASTRALGTADDVAAHLRAAGFAVAVRRRFACGVVAGFVAEPT